MLVFSELSKLVKNMNKPWSLWALNEHACLNFVMVNYKTIEQFYQSSSIQLSAVKMCMSR